jgi:3-mercaptopyruvate sulfurtransferase SseA
MNRNTNNRAITTTIALLAVFVAALFLGSCGGGDYEKPSTTLSGSSLISASTLKSWIDEGKVNGTGYDRVVILDVTTYATYTTGHVPGALFLDSNDLGQNRTDGVAVTTTEVPEGSKMDDLIQRYGIDGNTTILFTGKINDATRAYFTFRYWGFPKSRLKLLDGLNTSWSSAAYGLEAGLPPTVVRSSYSVKGNRALRSDLRVSLAEMIDYADGNVPNTIPLDVRSTPTAIDTSYGGARGKSSGVFDPKSDYTVFEGRIRGAQALLGTSFYDVTTFIFKPVDQLISSFAAVGIDSTKKTYVYCLVGKQSAPAFFVLDAILGWPVAIYDGSWSQWGQLSGNASKNGKLDPSSPWRTDIAGRSDLIVYNYESVISVPTFTGSGLNDLVTGSIYTSGTNSTFKVEIDSVGIPDTFKWTGNGGSTWTSNVQITGSAQTLVSGLTVSFASTTDHTLSDSWTFTATARKAVEQLTADPVVCSATYKGDGTKTTSLGGTQECVNGPNSFDTDANRIEEADKAYIGSGGTGTSGGGTSVPSGC